MKKVVSLLLVITIALGMGVGAFAAEDIAGYDNGTTLRDQYNDLYESEADVYDAEMDISAYDTSPYGMSRAAVNAAGNLEVAAHEIILVQGPTNDKRVVMPETELEPGTEYTFNFYYATGTGTTNIIPADTKLTTEASPITGAILGQNAKLRVRGKGGTSAISSAKIESRGSGTNKTWNLVITTKDNYGTKITDVNYELSFTGNLPIPTGQTAPTIDLAVGDASFQVGYQTMDDDTVDDFDEGDIITIYKETPVFTKKQLDRIAKNYNYKAVELEAEDDAWYYTGRVSGMSDTNFIWTHDVIPSIMNRLDQDFKFLTFSAGVTFPTNGEMRIDVSDVSDDWDRIYTYLYRNGTLTPVNTSYDAGADEIIFRTNYLGAFVMTDEEITDLTLLGNGSSSGSDSSREPSEGETSGSSSGAGTGSGNTDNPNMGTPASLNLVMGLGVVSLLTAGTVIVRKRK